MALFYANILWHAEMRYLDLVSKQRFYLLSLSSFRSCLYIIRTGIQQLYIIYCQQFKTVDLKRERNNFDIRQLLYSEPVGG